MMVIATQKQIFDLYKVHYTETEQHLPPPTILFWTR